MTFCTSESHGLGISEAASLRSFKPFFVEPTLPYSVFRGESFPLKVKVFSYLKECMAVSGSLQAGLEQRNVWKVLIKDPNKGAACLGTGQKTSKKLFNLIPHRAVTDLFIPPQKPNLT